MCYFCGCEERKITESDWKTLYQSLDEAYKLIDVLFFIVSGMQFPGKPVEDLMKHMAAGQDIDRAYTKAFGSPVQLTLLMELYGD